MSLGIAPFLLAKPHGIHTHQSNTEPGKTNTDAVYVAGEYTVMKILLVAPDHPDLPSVSGEIAAISSFHDVERVTGVVRDSDILRAIEKGDYEILWFATHGSGEGMLLSNSTLSPEGVGQYVSTSGVKLCVMNTCASEDVANRIIAGGDADMVFTISADVGDEDALRFGSLFARELAKTSDYQEAFKTAAGPGTTKYRYLKAKQALRGLALQATTITERMQERVESLTAAQYKLSADLTILDARVEQMSQQAMLTQQQAMQSQNSTAQMANLDRRLSQQNTASAPATISPTLIALIALIALVLLVAAYFIGRGP